MKECVQLGVNPVFGYPVMTFEERTISLLKKDVPEGLSQKFKLGRKPPPLQSDLEKQDLELMHETIELKDRYKK